MPNTFSCGRLMLGKDGSVKKLHLHEGGGSRDCEISHIDMGFDEIHDRLRDLFLQGKNNRSSKLYDFEMKELDTKRYTTFFDYIQKNGLKFKGTLLYLCTPSADNDVGFNISTPEKRRSATITQRPVVPRIPQVEADSSTPVIIIKPEDQPSPPQPAIQNLHISSYLTYSFSESLRELIDLLRKLVQEYNRELVLLQLFEHICTLHGLSMLILDQIKQQNHSIHENQKTIFDEYLDKIEKLSRTIKALIELNKMKISHIDQRSIITVRFNQFYQHFNTLKDRLSTEKAANRHNTPANYVIDPAPTTSFASSSSSSRYSSTKRTHTSSHRRSNDEDGYSLFKNLLKALDHLFDVLRKRHYASFGHLVEYLVDEVQAHRSNMKISDVQSLSDARHLLTSIDNRLSSRMNDEYHRAAPHQVPEQLEYAYRKSLDAIRDVLDSIEYYQSKINANKRTRTIVHEEKPTIHSFARNNTNENDDQSSEASHSSVGDELLMEVARDAYEQRPTRH